MIILDTDVLSEALRPVPDARVAGWLGGQGRASLFTTAITRAEILYGIRVMPAGKRHDRLWDGAVDIFDIEFSGRVLNFDSAAADDFALICASRRAMGRPISQLDAMIAAIARSRGAMLATRNRGDFADTGIAVVDPWNE